MSEKIIKKLLIQELKVIRRFKLRLNFNKYKFEEKFLFKLSKLISKYYGKKVEFNIVNLKSISYNSDIFTEILALKLKKQKSNPMDNINSLLAKAVLPHHNIFFGKVKLYKLTDLEKLVVLLFFLELEKKLTYVKTTLNLIIKLYFDTGLISCLVLYLMIRLYSLFKF